MPWHRRAFESAAGTLGPPAVQPPEAADFEQHARRIDEWANPGIGRVHPPHTDLHHPVAQTPGEPDQLDVEGEAVGHHVLEQTPGQGAVEQLEAALGVLDAPHPGEPDQLVEGLAHQLAVQRLMFQHPRILDRTAAQDHRSLGEPLL